MNPALHSSAGMMLTTLQDVFEVFTDALGYPIANISLRATTKSFSFQMHWQCAPATETATASEVKRSLQLFSLEIFKTHGYLVKINDPEVLS